MLDSEEIINKYWGIEELVTEEEIAHIKKVLELEAKENKIEPLNLICNYVNKQINNNTYLILKGTFTGKKLKFICDNPNAINHEVIRTVGSLRKPNYVVYGGL